MKKNTQQRNKGFTLIETMIAVFVLTAALSGFFALIANSLFSARYARNEITANYLLQEAVDSIRNDRDTTAFQNNDPSTNTGWDTFLNKYRQGGCFTTFDSKNGCYFEPADPLSMPALCNVLPTFGSANCPTFNYDENATNKDFYTYKNSGVRSNFKRQIIMQVNPNRADELDVKVTLEWLNGNLLRTQSLVISLLNWQKQ